MTASSTIKCPACGSAASGRFCSSCGAVLAAGRCAQCGRDLPAGAQFCRDCGTPAGGRPAAAPSAADRGSRTGWIAAAGLGVALVAVVIAFLAQGERRGAAAAGAAATTAAAPEGAPPDISNLTPKERYDRLYNRVMRAAESGDQATVAQFTPMAVMAYQQLDTIDADARFHMAMLLLHTGEVPGARAEADSLLKLSPGHLFGYMIRGAVARFDKDDAALKKAQGEFLARYDAEMKAKRPEYAEHERAVSDFRAAARGEPPGRVGAGS